MRFDDSFFARSMLAGGSAVERVKVFVGDEWEE